MITGVNSDLFMDGVKYHVQIEDEEAASSLEVRVYVGGEIIFRKHHAYGPALKGFDGARRIKNAIRYEQERLLTTVKAAVSRGLIREPVSPRSCVAF